ncbi:uncharacterized protein MONBRDRAFT_12186 [Monosiga brevicollis MX1]|uniref:Uncharacterized protein n=1 Tax=Monosiga brevicollis TaxID=81824 RepID=A9VBH1_MONBE|nr:uncharacterized protein MONBRDRAFT_12186 [Monosiga brevicollis MX1]EDQ85060.1 predicted protein [Monosiga brevicollis MX1]|eukprot:XP_001750064.1 hypothetical protein [Monosiga brevicollis MX1]
MSEPATTAAGPLGRLPGMYYDPERRRYFAGEAPVVAVENREVEREAALSVLPFALGTASVAHRPNVLHRLDVWRELHHSQRTPLSSARRARLAHIQLADARPIHPAPAVMRYAAYLPHANTSVLYHELCVEHLRLESDPVEGAPAHTDAPGLTMQRGRMEIVWFSLLPIASICLDQLTMQVAAVGRNHKLMSWMRGFAHSVEHRPLPACTSDPTCLHTSPAAVQGLGVIGCRNGDLYLVDTRAPRPERPRPTLRGLNMVYLYRQDPWLLTNHTAQDQGLRLYDVRHLTRPLLTFQGYAQYTNHNAVPQVSHGEAYVAAVDNRGLLRVFRPDRAAPVITMRVPKAKGDCSWHRNLVASDRDELLFLKARMFHHKVDGFSSTRSVKVILVSSIAQKTAISRSDGKVQVRTWFLVTITQRLCMGNAARRCNTTQQHTVIVRRGPSLRRRRRGRETGGSRSRGVWWWWLIDSRTIVTMGCLNRRRRNTAVVVQGVNSNGTSVQLQQHTRRVVAFDEDNNATVNTARHNSAVQWASPAASAASPAAPASPGSIGASPQPVSALRQTSAASPSAAALSLLDLIPNYPSKTVPEAPRAPPRTLVLRAV